jgi:hypothetical protein
MHRRGIRNCPKRSGLNKSMHILLKTASSNAVAVAVTNHQIQSSVDGPYNRVVLLEVMLCHMPANAGYISIIDILIVGVPA